MVVLRLIFPSLFYFTVVFWNGLRKSGCQNEGKEPYKSTGNPSPLTGVIFLKNPKNGKNTMHKLKTLWEKLGKSNKRHIKQDTKQRGNELAFTGITIVFLAESCHGDPVTNSKWQRQRLKTL
jgi:hypothetical protein